MSVNLFEIIYRSWPEGKETDKQKSGKVSQEFGMKAKHTKAQWVTYQLSSPIGIRYVDKTAAVGGLSWANVCNLSRLSSGHDERPDV